MIATLTLGLITLTSHGAFADTPSADTTRICLAPTSAEVASGNPALAGDAVRDAFTAFLTGPSLGATRMSARLESQVRAEAKAAKCRQVLFTTLRLTHQKSGGGMLGRMAAGAVETGAWTAVGSAGPAVARGATAMAVTDLGLALRTFAGTVKVKDELTLSYRLEGTDGRALLSQSEKRTADADGEDLLTPMVERASIAIAGVESSPPH